MLAPVFSRQPPVALRKCNGRRRCAPVARNGGANADACQPVWSGGCQAITPGDAHIKCSVACLRRTLLVDVKGPPPWFSICEGPRRVALIPTHATYNDRRQV